MAITHGITSVAMHHPLIDFAGNSIAVDLLFKELRYNTPGGIPLIKQTLLPTVADDDITQAVATWTRTAILMARLRLVSQHALNALTLATTFSPPSASIPHVLRETAPPMLHINFEHYANPILHPVMGQTISSYKKLMNNPTTAEVWQTAFGKDFGGMAQGDNKTGQKETNAMFVMTHVKIAHVYREKKIFTFANPVVDYRPQKKQS
jgi:hypothetical protein